jgi:amidase
MALAGVPMTLGSRPLESYVPAQDCVVADRVLAAGGEIVAKLNMDGFAWSAGAETSDFGPILKHFGRRGGRAAGRG